MKFVKTLWSQKKAQVSMEFILLTGGVIVAVLTLYSLRGTIQSFANVISNWVEQERNLTITKLTR